MNERIFQELKESARIKLLSINTEFSTLMEPNFDLTLKSAVERMERESRTTTNDIQIAKTNLNKLIDELAKFREKQLGGKDIIRFQAINESTKGLCPLWPIC